MTWLAAIAVGVALPLYLRTRETGPPERVLRAIALGLALLLYLRSPIDVLPDRLGPIGLLDDIVAVLAAIWWLRRRATGSPAARESRTPGADIDGAAASTEWDPYAVLGVVRGASAEEIAKAYREQMLRYHPDRVAHLGEELRQLAHRKALEIQRAYAEVGKRA
jgi:DnaJ like chaperone protein